MNKYEGIYLKAKERNKNASWLDSAIAILAGDLEAYTGQAVKVSGPFGLRAEVLFQVGGHYTTITPSFPNGGFELYYDTGETTDNCPPGSLGELNGFNHVQRRLPETFAAIANIMAPVDANGK